ncbi:MAG: hypothetical protein J6A01_05495 [Proteobacteria bacterium]|nr:hypothetical protein [Pseudomonadota bacterium]
MKKNTLYLLAIIAFLCALTACKKNSEIQDEQKPVVPETPLPGSPEEVVLATDAVKLTMRDYDRCIDVHRLKGHVLNQRVLANPRFQRDEVQLCLQSAYLKKYLKDNHVEVLPVERQVEIQRAMEHAGAQSEAVLAEKLGVSVEVLNEIVDEAVIPAAMQRALATRIPNEEAKKHFMRDERKYTVEIADFDNTPTDEDIELFTKNSQDKMTAYLSGHPETVMTPPRADLARFAYAFDDDPDNEQRAYQKMDQLRQFAVTNGAEKTVEFCQKEANHGCQVLNDTKNRLILDRSDETAWAFRIPVGGVSDIKRETDHHEILILLDIRAPEAMNVRDPANMKLVAANVMKQSEPAPHLIDVLKPALEAPEPDFKAVTETNGGHFQHYENVSFFDLSSHKNLRSAQELLKILAEVKPEQKDLFSNPIVYNNHLFIFRVKDLTDPTEEELKNNLNQWKAKKATDPSRDLVVDWLNQNMPSMTSLNIKPIQAKYGILQPNGTIR